MKAARAILILLVMLIGGHAMSENGGNKIIVEIDGRVYKWVQVAEKELVDRKLSIEGRKIIVLDTGDSVVISFIDAKASDEQRGSSGSIPGFEVEVKKSDLKVLRSNYVR